MPPDAPADAAQGGVDERPPGLARVPLLRPDERAAGPQARTADGRRLRPAARPARVPALQALAGAGLAVAGVALGIVALLTLTDGPGGDPVLDQHEASGEMAGAAAPGVSVPPISTEAPTAPVATAPGATAPVATAPVATASSVVVPAPGAAAPRASASAAAPARTRSPLPGAAAPRAAAPRPAAPRAAAPRPAVVVLNNSTRTGLADRAAVRFRRAGWPVALVGNYRGKIRATTVYYPRGRRAEAQRFAASFRGVARVLPRPARLPGPAGLTVVLTRDFAA